MSMNERIRKYIIDHGLRFNFVAESAGFKPKTFYGMMNNKSRITTEEYERICIDGLKISPAYFYGKEFLETKKTA